MSYTELKLVEANGDIVGADEFRNAHGWTAMVWDALVNKYRVEDIYREKGRFDHNVFIGAMDLWKPLWDYVKDGTLELRPWEYNVLQATYDDVLIKAEDCPLLVDSLLKFDEAHRTPRYVCHVGAIARAIDTNMIAYPDTLAVGFYGMSVGQDMFGEVYDLEYPEDSDHPEYEEQCEAWENSARCYNINKDTRHWYAELRPL